MCPLHRTAIMRPLCGGIVANSANEMGTKADSSGTNGEHRSRKRVGAVQHHSLRRVIDRGRGNVSCGVSFAPKPTSASNCLACATRALLSLAVSACPSCMRGGLALGCGNAFPVKSSTISKRCPVAMSSMAMIGGGRLGLRGMVIVSSLFHCSIVPYYHIPAAKSRQFANNLNHLTTDSPGWLLWWCSHVAINPSTHYRCPVSVRLGGRLCL